MYLDLLKVFIPTAFTFFFGIIITPLATHFFYKYKMWKKKVRTIDVASEDFKKVHAQRERTEVSVPCVGGIIVWASVLLSVLFFYLISIIFPNTLVSEFNFFSRSQTFIPIGVLILGALLGLIDDMLEITGKSNITRQAPWYTRTKIIAVLIIGFIAGWWFYYKLGMDSISIPFDGYLYLGILFIPFVVFVIFSTFSSSVIDGIDGLSGGVLVSIFTAYSVVAYLNNQLDLAAFSGVVTGATLAFLWFNIPPARFYMGETGMMPLTIVLATIAFLTDTVLILPIIAFPLVATSFSSSVQILAKKYFNTKVFRVAPLHHHFEAIGWPSYKVTMRYWVISAVFAIIGVVLTIISR